MSRRRLEATVVSFEPQDDASRAVAAIEVRLGHACAHVLLDVKDGVAAVVGSASNLDEHMARRALALAKSLYRARLRQLGPEWLRRNRETG